MNDHNFVEKGQSHETTLHDFIAHQLHSLGR